MLNWRESRILPLALQLGRVTCGQCQRAFGCCGETARLDLAHLVSLGLLEQRGNGRGVYYVPRGWRSTKDG